MNRLDTLKAAAECVCGSREDDYGSPEDNFSVIAALWTAYTGTDITPKDVAMDGNPHRFTLWETAMQFIRDQAAEERKKKT